MSKPDLRSFGKTALAAACFLALGAATAQAGAAFADRTIGVTGNADMLFPAPDSAALAMMPGMINNLKLNPLQGDTATINDGIVIRQSRIENGKIVIPPHGLYVVSRAGNFEPFNNFPFTIAGKVYRAINDHYSRVVVRNVTMKKGDQIYMDAAKTRGCELSSFGADGESARAAMASNGSGTAVFKVVKTTGNYYGSTFPVIAGDASIVYDIKTPEGMARLAAVPEGETVPTKANGLDWGGVTAFLATSGRSHVLVDKVDVDAGTVTVRELATDKTTECWISPTDPVLGEYAKGDSFMLGKAKVEVTDVSADSATVKISDAKGVTTKVFGPMTKANTEHLFLSRPELDMFWALSASGTEAVLVNLRDEAPFANGKVKLVSYMDVLDVPNGSVWAADPRFLAIPDT